MSPRWALLPVSGTAGALRASAADQMWVLGGATRDSPPTAYTSWMGKVYKLNKKLMLSGELEMPPTNVCWPSRSSICRIRASEMFASACSSIRASSSADVTGFFGMRAIVPDAAGGARLDPAIMAASHATRLG